MPAVSHTQAAASAVVHSTNVKCSSLPGPGKVGRILRRGLAERAEGVLANVRHFVRLLHRVVVTTNLFDAASGRADDVVVVLKVLHEEALRCLRVGLVTAVGHRLPAASLIERVVYIEPEPFQQL